MRNIINNIADVVGLLYKFRKANVMFESNSQHVSAKSISCLLTTEQKEYRIKAYQDVFQHAADVQSFMMKIITVDESWFGDYDPETK